MTKEEIEEYVLSEEGIEKQEHMAYMVQQVNMLRI